MQTYTITQVYHDIKLGSDEEFDAKPPFHLRKYRIGYIRVYKGCFVLYGDPKRRGALLEIDHSYGCVDDVPNMPFAVAQRVQTCLDWFEATGNKGLTSSVFELPVAPATTIS